MVALGQFTPVAGGICAARGFQVAGVRCGIKRKRRDVALILGGVTAAGVMTTNFMCAPSVTRNRKILAASGGRARAIVVNAGNANVGNGPQGERDNETMAVRAAEAIRLSPDEVLTASTGVIGHFLPMEKIVLGIDECGRALERSPEAGAHAAEAILTTDTFAKEYAVEFNLDGVTVHVGGIAKGSGMIAPNMATMLAFLTTDLAVAPTVLDAALRLAVEVSFNCLTVDGDTSTSDQCLILASGAAGLPEITAIDSPEGRKFVAALTDVCVHLAKEVARDGEGATKLVTVRVSGGPDVVGARRVAKSIGESPLVKTALFGNDPNWGRLLMAAGKAGVPFDPDRATASLAGVEVFRHGRPTPFDAAALSKAMAVRELEIQVDLGAGDGEATVYTCDFSYDYVKINAEYHT
ncbi:MAG: bifunctional glutamate N-acetyltransferase/amino-acid acetyltransferase ArgJ [Bacteroidia bacterium]|nr:bifunctional glutamate N-acetyltransferase/amino-acid acetyltransferase ArgJ [Bacteroidia bacterium]